MKTTKRKETPEEPAAAYERAILDKIPDEVVPGWKAKPEDKDDVFDRAMLIAHSRPRDQGQTARRLLREAEFEVGEKRLVALAEEADASPQLAAEQRGAWNKYLNDPKHAVGYQEGVKLITGRQKWDDALNWFKRFWAEKAKREGKSEIWVEAKLEYYRGDGFALAKVKELREEFMKFSGYRGQGKVLKETDGRLKKNKHLKELKTTTPAKRGRPRTKIELEYTDNLEAIQARQAGAGMTPQRKSDY